MSGAPSTSSSENKSRVLIGRQTRKRAAVAVQGCFCCPADETFEVQYCWQATAAGEAGYECHQILRAKHTKHSILAFSISNSSRRRSKRTSHSAPSSSRSLPNVPPAPCRVSASRAGAFYSPLCYLITCLELGVWGIITARLGTYSKAIIPTTADSNNIRPLTPEAMGTFAGGSNEEFDENADLYLSSAYQPASLPADGDWNVKRHVLKELDGKPEGLCLSQRTSAPLIATID